ncbi:tetraacyldisaccharide 4'-kinase [Emticicia aquatilis]|uniref:Tetraacyldisaccharide 4'-kinase n=2 Tax=Emticicia aquatilis TaxID=1537369 RepID=A0A916YZ58_9BACT|nr:tetraacyldisaccharide 4'-kinase [Emticicia aquatilis]
MKSVSPKVLTINVGNLSLGGTGKTPHVEYLVRLLSDKYKVSTLSRGYGRKTKGFIVADNQASAETIGDEPMQYYLKFKNKINVTVCENRVEGVEEIGRKLGDNQLIILDDAFQHRKIAPYFNLLLSDYNKPFYEDSLVPFGRLRDIRNSAKRADAVIITKCPSLLTKQEKATIRNAVLAYTKADIPVFFSKIHYQEITGYTTKNVFETTKNIGVLTAIAKPEVFVKYLSEKNLSIGKIFDFPDHYAFTRKDIDKVLGESHESLQLITTEKDMVKLKPQLSENEIKRFFYVPIEIEIENKTTFDTLINSKIHSFYQKISH